MHLGGRQLPCFGDLCDLRGLEPDDHVLRFEVGVDDLAHPVHVIETDQTLSSKFSCQRHWDSLIVVPLNDLQEIYSEDLEHHDEVLAVRPMVDERVEKLHAVGSVAAHSKLVKFKLEDWIFFVVFFNGRFPFFTPPILRDLIQNFDLIVGSLQIVLCAFLYLDSHIATVLEILCQPNGRKVAPTKFLDDNVPVE